MVNGLEHVSNRQVFVLAAGDDLVPTISTVPIVFPRIRTAARAVAAVYTTALVLGPHKTLVR